MPIPHRRYPAAFLLLLSACGPFAASKPHWSDPPYFAGVPIPGSKSAIEGSVPLTNCRTVAGKAASTLVCDARLLFAGAFRDATLIFLGDEPHPFLSLTLPAGPAEYSSVKSDLVRFYGEPRQRLGPSGSGRLYWSGKKTALWLDASPKPGGPIHLGVNYTGAIAVVRPLL